MGHPQVLHQLGEPLHSRALLLVLHPLGDEGVEIELLCRLARRDDHQRARHRLWVARDQRGGAIARQLRGPGPLEQGHPDREQRQSGEDRQPHTAPQAKEDEQGGAVEHVVGVHVCRLVCEHHPAPLVVEYPDELGVDHHDGPVGAHREGVGKRELGEVEVRDRVHVEGVEDLTVQDPHARELLLAEAYGGAQRGGPECSLIAQRHQLADHLVEIGHLLQRGGCGPVGRVLVGPRGNAIQLPGLGGK